MIWSGDLVVEAADREDYSSVERVEGFVHLRPDASLIAPALVRVGRDLRAEAGAQLDAPALRAAGGLWAYPRTALSVPSLRQVGDLLVFSETYFSAPSLEEVDCLVVAGGATADLPALRQVARWVVDSLNRARVRGAGNQVVDGPGDLRRHRRRYLAQLTTAPHARCPRAGRCVEHERDPRVEACRKN